MALHWDEVRNTTDQKRIIVNSKLVTQVEAWWNFRRKGGHVHSGRNERSLRPHPFSIEESPEHGGILRRNSRR
jgi:hypothetical protein